jgi:putative transposase
VRRQCTLSTLARAGVSRPEPAPAADDLALRRRIDELPLEPPFYGSRRMMFELTKEGRGVNRKRVRRLMREGDRSFGSAPRRAQSRAIAIRNGSRPALLWTQDISLPDHRAEPRGLPTSPISRPTSRWRTAFCISFLYLGAIIDWASRAVLAWRLSNTIDSGFCVEAPEEALARRGKPRIFDTDQGAQFTSCVHRQA